MRRQLLSSVKILLAQARAARPRHAPRPHRRFLLSEIRQSDPAVSGHGKTAGLDCDDRLGLIQVVGIAGSEQATRQLVYQRQRNRYIAR